MRKLISMGMLALFLGMLAAPAFAGNVDACDILKDDKFSKGLYGLCIAYWNADNANARQRILANFKKKATGPDDPSTIPGGSQCPCWTDTRLADVVLQGTPFMCAENEDGIGIEFAWYDDQSVQFVVIDGDPSQCFHFSPVDPVGFTDLTEEAEAACRDDIHFLVDESFGGVCLPLF